MKKGLSIILSVSMLGITFCTSGCNNTVQNTDATATSSVATESTTESTQNNQTDTEKIIFDVTTAYTNKPYTNEFALDRVSELQYLDEESLYQLCSIDESPIFYDGFFYEDNTFNVVLDTYAYDMDNETVRKYFDTYEYSKFASIGALRVIDSFVYDDVSGNKLIYYCYYTITHWSEDETLDTMDYYRDVITIDKNNSSITLQEKVAMVTNLEVPKEITGDHDFHGVI